MFNTVRLTQRLSLARSYKQSYNNSVPRRATGGTNLALEWEEGEQHVTQRQKKKLSRELFLIGINFPDQFVSSWWFMLGKKENKYWHFLQFLHPNRALYFKLVFGFPAFFQPTSVSSVGG